ncbi:MAG: primosomal protein N' [Phycisphaeraceae bacterium]|nr:MAG: primosomal protein N' [Phycisphaeraceae bacterium]
MEQLPFHRDENKVEQPVAHTGRFVRVAVERGLDAEGLTYREGDTPLDAGDRVEVPLGRGNTPTGGLVIETGGPELLGDFDPRKVKAVLRRTGSVLQPSMIGLARWMSDYYVTPLGMVIAAMVPAAVKQAVGKRTREMLRRVDGAPEPGRLPPAAAKAWTAICEMDAASFPIDPAHLVHRVGVSNAGPINRLVREGLLERIEVEDVRVFGESPTSLLLDQPAPPPALTEAQTRAIEGIAAFAREQPFAVHLIRGVTGSGKTEVYIRLIERTLAAGRGAIVLVPEIALTPQTAGRFVARLATGPDATGVEVLHSGLSASARNKAWSRLASGESRVAVGARSAVFAPIANPGLIIVDEEHDSSYKQDQLPRYNARDVAVKRAQLVGAHAVLGSATPSLESWSNAMPPRPGARPRYHLWELPERVAGRMPDVRIVGPREGADRTQVHTVANGWIGIGPILAEAMGDTFDAGGQVILLLNRRGFASYVACASARCDWSMGCDACDARMVVHRAGLRPGQHAPRGYLRCHHCLAESIIPAACPECGTKLILVGLGIQRVERELADRFNLEPGRDFARLDSDSVRRAADYFDVLDRFSRGELNLLLGTQMVAKGLDFPNVRLVGVVNADTSLVQPDFRAAERTFQLVSQVAGRAGRGMNAGLVIVQTLHPDEPAITLAAAHDYPAFASAELRERRRCGYPPAARMARVVCRDRKAATAERDANDIAGRLRDASPRGVRIEGPMPCVLSRVADHFRFEVLVTAPNAPVLTTLLGGLRQAGLLKADSRTAVDIDPVSLL